MPRGRYQDVPGGLRNVIGTVRGREPGYVVVGAHYDTKDVPGFVGANDGASGTAVAAQLARTIGVLAIRSSSSSSTARSRRAARPTAEFEQKGLRGSKVAAPRFADARAMVLLDFVGDRQLAIRYEENSSRGLWRKLRSAAHRAGALEVFPRGNQGPISDDHIPFVDEGVPSIDLIDFGFPCWHRRCDDMSAVSERSVNAVGETIYELLRGL